MKRIPDAAFTQPRFVFVVAEKDRPAFEEYTSRIGKTRFGKTVLDYTLADLGPHEFLYINDVK